MTDDNIDYILEAVVARGWNKNLCQCNDFITLLEKKDFKELVALELYECYFWEDRHEFDLQLLRELVDKVAAYWCDPETITRIHDGLLWNLPTAIIIGTAAYIYKILSQGVSEKHIPNDAKDVSVSSPNTVCQNPEEDADKDETSAWIRIKNNAFRIAQEFKNRNYILSDEIEGILDTSRGEIEPLLKLCGFKCYYGKKRSNRKRSIWVKPDLSDEETKIVLKDHGFKHR
jgi:hypothetical protein